MYVHRRSWRRCAYFSHFCKAEVKSQNTPNLRNFTNHFEWRIFLRFAIEIDSHIERDNEKPTVWHGRKVPGISRGLNPRRKIHVIRDQRFLNTTSGRAGFFRASVLDTRKLLVLFSYDMRDVTERSLYDGRLSRDIRCPLSRQYGFFLMLGIIAEGTTRRCPFYTIIIFVVPSSSSRRAVPRNILASCRWEGTFPIFCRGDQTVNRKNPANCLADNDEKRKDKGWHESKKTRGGGKR